MIGVFIPKGSETEDTLRGCVRAPNNLRPLGLKNTDVKIITGTIVRRLSRALPEVVCKIQRGFVPSRNFGNNIVELDGASREYSQQDDVSVAMPLL
eukprot:5298017-Pyramimonas_sp.AAC.1